mgnify:CR=1 FL=1
MAVEPYTAAAFVVSVCSLGVVGIVGWAAKRGVAYIDQIRDDAHDAREASRKNYRILVGTEELENDGLIDRVEDIEESARKAGIHPAPERVHPRQPAQPEQSEGES